VDAGGFAGLAATQPLPWALLALAAAGPTAPALAALGAALASRTWLQLEVDRAIGGKGRTPYVPLRDLLSAYVFVTSFFVGTVDWRGRRYDVHADGTIASQESPRA
jgi:ceramide glucosyltransferase